MRNWFESLSRIERDAFDSLVLWGALLVCAALHIAGVRP